MKVQHLVIYPSGKLEWVELDYNRRYDDLYCGDWAYDLNQIYRIIGCDCVEQVSLRIPGVVILIDESGKIKEPAQEHNELVSRLYGGYAFGDDIVGPAIFFSQEGPNIRPLLPLDRARLSLCLGVPLPANK